ncbi:MAG: hypothetical protein LAO21_02430 [Acidobacteriia bacterium]|nr:hypothetical protein [Terriglobia bacterium]
MGLDAFVYCDCIEKKRLKTRHPFPELLVILPDGSPDVETSDPKKQDRHDRWMEKRACRHEQCMLAGEWLGNGAWISELWTEINRVSRKWRRKFPVLRDQVIYCGTHTGDYLALKDVRRLEKEIKFIRAQDLEKAKVKDLEGLNKFLSKLERLVKASLKVGKPIAF